MILNERSRVIHILSFLFFIWHFSGAALCDYSSKKYIEIQKTVFYVLQPVAKSFLLKLLC